MKKIKDYEATKRMAAIWSQRIKTLHDCIVDEIHEVMSEHERVIPGAQIEASVSFPRVNEGIISSIYNNCVMVDADDMITEFRFTELSVEELLQVLDIVIQTKEGTDKA